MLFLIQNQVLTTNRPRTYITKAVSSGATTISVRGISLSEWTENDYVIVGEIGAQNAELAQVTADATDANEISIQRAGGGGLKFNHSIDEPVYRIDYNQIKVYRSETESGTKTLLATVDITPNAFETRYDDLINRDGFGFATLYNSQRDAESDFSDAIPYEGLSERSLAKMTEEVRSHLNEKDDDFIDDTEIADALNSRQRDILNYRMWTFNETERSQSSVRSQFDYPIDEDIKTLFTVRFNSAPMEYKSRSVWERLNYDTDAVSDNPLALAVFGRNMRFYPKPSTDAATTTLTADIDESQTSIPVDGIGGFRRADYYRFKINDEVVYATEYDTDTQSLVGVRRGMENTTPATHNENDTVRDRNIVYTGQLYATRLREQGDETPIPEPEVLVYGATADIANGKLKDHNRGDRFEQKYAASYEELKKKFAIKLTGQKIVVKTMEELGKTGVTDTNKYPTNIVAP